MKVLLWRAGLVVALMGGLAGCASPRNTGVVPERSMDAAALSALPVFRGDGTPSSMDEVVASAAEAEVVLIGENHGHPVGLPWAALVFDRVLERTDTAALSLEFFERDDQSRVDDYLLGLSDEAAFRKRADLTAGGYPPGHRRMLEAAKAKGRPVIASNTPREIIRYLRGKDYGALGMLTAEQRRMFRVPEVLPEGKYREDFYRLMRSSVESEAGHRGGGGERATALTEEQVQERLAGRFRAQSLWDWTMGESVTRALEAGSRPVVHVVGRFHSDFRGGLAQAIERLRAGTRLVVVSVVDEESAAFREEDRGRGDYVVYVGPSPEER